MWARLSIIKEKYRLQIVNKFQALYNVLPFGHFDICPKAWFPYDRNGRKNRVTIFLNGQFIIVYTWKPHINHKYSLVIITPRIFSSKILYFG
jgi:hypothetical protein